MMQLEAVSVSPSGKAPPAVIEQLVVAPLFAMDGVIERALPTVPDTELGVKLRAGAPWFTVMVTCAVDDPEALVAVTV
jgi:hypothetical protein